VINDSSLNFILRYLVTIAFWAFTIVSVSSCYTTVSRIYRSLIFLLCTCTWDLRFSWKWLQTLPSSGMWQHAVC